MKLDVILSYVLSILEGCLAGTCFYRAGQAKETRCRVFFYLASAAWFVLSVLNGIEGARMHKNAKTIEINGGNDNE
ncbi:MAG: hypothetical protein K2O45_12915 [Oscillospiraceae bacterium]|nr:hypothetical protein [Oscillospiraceae bacterium]